MAKCADELLHLPHSPQARELFIRCGCVHQDAIADLRCGHRQRRQRGTKCESAARANSRFLHITSAAERVKHAKFLSAARAAIVCCGEECWPSKWRIERAHEPAQTGLAAFRIGSAGCGGELMKAIVQERYGGPALLRLADIQVPEPGRHRSGLEFWPAL